MKPAPALAEGFPDLSGMRIAREPHWFRWLSAALIILVLAAMIADGSYKAILDKWGLGTNAVAQPMLNAAPQ